VCPGSQGVSQRGSKTENIAQSHGREAPSLGLIREPRFGERNGVGESVSGEEESSYARIRLHPGCTTSRSESDWHLTGVYCSHPACHSKPLECFSGCATCV